MDPVSVVGLVASIVGLIDSTVEIIRFLNDVNNAPKEWTTFAREASNLLSALITLRYTVSDVTDDDPWFAGIRSLGRTDGPLDQFHQSLAELTKRLALRSNAMDLKGRILWSLDKKYINGKLLQLERLKSLITVALTRDQIGLAQAIKAEVDLLAATALQSGQQLHDLHDKFSYTHNQEFLSWLSPLTYSAKHNDAFSKCQAGSYQWLLAMPEFQNWASDGQCMLWASGMPGAGKTILTSFLVEELKKSTTASDVRVQYVYLNYKELKQSPSTVIGSLVKQILEEDVNQGGVLRNKYESSLKNNKPASLVDLRDFLYDSLDRHPKAFVFFDALDEYDEGNGDRSLLVEELTKLSKRRNIHVMVTSRWLASLQRDLSGSVCIEVRASDSDVETYVRCQLKSSARLQGHLRQDSALEAEIVTGVVSRCQGMFLLAKLHMDSLSTKLNRRSIREELQRLPRKLEETYMLVLERIQNQNEDDANLAYQLLTWLTYCRRPLTVTEIQHAMAVSLGDENLYPDDLIDPDILLSVCAGIVVIEKQSLVIRLIHYTTEEYLRSIRQIHHKFVGGPEIITRICATYLGSRDFEQGFVMNRNAFKKALKPFPFYEYAATFWADHAKQGVEEVSQREMLRFLLHDKKASMVARCTDKSWYGTPIQYGIHLAARFGLTVTMSNLLTAGTDVLSQDSFGKTALHYACAARDEAAVSFVISHQNAVRIPQVAWLAIHLAVSYNAYHVVEMLLGKHVKDLMSEGSTAQIYFGRTPLHRAVLADHNLINLLLSKLPSSSNRADSFGMTALHIASICGKEKAVQALLLGGVSPKMVDNYKCTPLLYAVERDQDAIVQMLLEYGTRETLRCGKSPILSAARLGKSSVLERLLKEHPTAVNETDASGWTALHFAAASRYPETVAVLLRNGADVAMRTCDGLTASDLELSSMVSNRCIPPYPAVPEEGSMSISHDAKPSPERAAKLRRKKGVLQLQKLLTDAEDFIDAFTILQVFEMNDEDSDGYLSQSLFSHCIIEIKHRMITFEEALFLRNIDEMMSLRGLSVEDFSSLGFTAIKGLWEQIETLVRPVQQGTSNFNDTLASQLARLVMDLVDAQGVIEQLVYDFEQLPFITDDEIDFLKQMFAPVRDRNLASLPPRSQSS